MNEDIAQSNFIIDWDIQDAIERYLNYHLAQLSPLHNFTCHTQILYHSPLAFIPTVFNESGKLIHTVEQDDLKAFINDADWKLASPVTMDPVLHFVLWVPSSAHRPFKIRKSNGMMDADGSFIRPQWGSVQIYNPEPNTLSTGKLNVFSLERPMAIFCHHLMSLLGVVEWMDEGPTNRAVLGFDSLIRRRVIENAADTVKSLGVVVELIDAQKNMRVSKLVQDQVNHSLRFLEQAQKTLLRDGSLWNSLQQVDQAARLSAQSVFNPTMLSLLYFPDEHKYAVYTPLFGPVLVPLVLGVIKEVSGRIPRRVMNKKKIKAE